MFDQKTPKNTDSIENDGNTEILIWVIIGSEQNQKADTGTNQEACHHLSRVQYAHKI